MGAGQFTRLVLVSAAALGLVAAAALWWPRPEEIGPDIAPPRLSGLDDGGFRIVALGTSLTARYDWPEELGRRLSDCLGMPARVIPIARGGATSRWGAGQLSRIETEKPDLVLVEFSVNDADLRRGVSLDDSLRLHRRILERLSERVPEAGVVLMSMSPAWGVKRLLRPRLASYYALYPDLAVESGAGFVDLYRAWMARPGAAEAFPDGVHPKPSAATAVILPALTRYILAAPPLESDRAAGTGCAAAPGG